MAGFFFCHSDNFYPRPPRGGRHAFFVQPVLDAVISIHALREEGDHGFGSLTHLCWKFLSTPSARRATMILPMTESRLWLFLSTPSARRATS